MKKLASLLLVICCISGLAQTRFDGLQQCLEFSKQNNPQLKIEKLNQLNLTNHRIAGEKYKQGIYSIDQYVNIYQEMVRSQNQYLNKIANYLVFESIVTTRNALK